MALDPPKHIQHDLGQAAVVPSGGEGVHQKGKVPLWVDALVLLLQHILQHLGHHHMALPLVAQAEVRVQIQQVPALPKEGCTEGVNGGDLRLIDQGGLPAEVPVIGGLRQPGRQLLGDAGPQLPRGRLGVGDDQELVQVQPLPGHPVHEPLHQHPGLARACGGGDQQLPAPVIHDPLLFLCQGKGHGLPLLSSCQASFRRTVTVPCRSVRYTSVPAASRRSTVPGSGWP